MRALPSFALLLATTGLTVAAQAQTAPSPLHLETSLQARLAPRPVAEASFRPLSVMDDALHLNGEQGIDERAVFLTQAEALRATAFRIAYLNAVSNLPDASRLMVRVNDQTIGEVRLDANAAEATAILPIPPGVIVPGYNSVRLIATQRHRVDCSVRATYELWSAISLNRSGFVGLQPTPALRRIADLPALAASGAERTPIRVRLARTSDTAAIDLAMRAANALVLAAGIQRPIIDVAEEQGEGAGIDLVVGREAPAGSTPLDGEMGLFYLHDAAEGRTTLTLRSGPEGERSLQRLVEFANAPNRIGSEPGRRALANTAGRQVRDGSQLSFSELGFESRAFDGSFFQSSMRVNMPSDFFAAPYGAARLELDSAFLGAAAVGRRVNIRINDQIAAVVPVNQGGSSQIEQRRVELPIQMFKAGANTVTVEADLVGSDRACDATAARTSNPRLLIAGSSRINFGSLARVTVLPSLSATLTHGYPYLGREEPTTVAVSSASPAYLNAAMTWVGRMSAAARTSMPVTFRFGPLDDPDTSGLFFGPPGEASQTLARSMMAVEQTRAAQTTARDTEIANARAAADAAVVPAADGKMPSLAERLRVSAAASVAGSLARGDLSPVAAWLEDFGLIERDTALGSSAGALLTPDGLTILQEVGTLPPQSWRSIFERQPLPNIKTMVLAASPEALEELIAKATTAHAWTRFNGEAALLRTDSWAPENRAAQQRHYLPTAFPSPANLRLSIAGWLSLNQSYYLGGLIMLSMLLAFTTALVLKGRRP
ncbi:MAG TPA: cellulose biosynthesis cyclic di-GMP-binding regulatory protein BcsB [Bosea sp. (in: a-proteobacteria)]|uniref:cellulose biosynthesis cyclic di-GMP-binding regulatory protein BcsB n=1 Tax=Bosea sp. (in: a-proteobacteria) TaxID=1871050 RepID=UPI002E0F5ECC|nr:cellulose biosynthesis cyclic di-GMP-binding regulatory protein BcsB [Bosea sp. (in: a-proteobacteria)]